MQILGEQRLSDLFLEPRTVSGTQQAFNRCQVNKCRGYNEDAEEEKFSAIAPIFAMSEVRNIQVKGEVASATLDFMLTLTKEKPLKTFPK